MRVRAPLVQLVIVVPLAWDGEFFYLESLESDSDSYLEQQKHVVVSFVVPFAYPDYHHAGENEKLVIPMKEEKQPTLPFPPPSSSLLPTAYSYSLHIAASCTASNILPPFSNIFVPPIVSDAIAY